ncbi:MAG: type II toxin-antitoxin system VapC family toxin [Micrococcales bacterium]|nr:type II toxin-antitoxin system VapC family toxin [Micrococcales bacterium]
MLDASVAVHALVPGTLQTTARARLAGTEPVAPTLIDTEVLSALARLERADKLEAPTADAAVAAWSTFPCERVGDTRLLPHVWALRHRLRIADAHYVALAQALDLPLLTADRRLAATVTDVTLIVVQ